MASNKKKSLTPPKQKMSKKTKRIIVVTAVAVMALLLVAGTLLVLFQNGIIGNSEKYKKLAADRKTVATCNGFEIPYEELRFVTDFYKKSLAHAYGEGIWDDPATAEKHRKELETLVMDHLNENYLILSACRVLSIQTDTQDQKDYVNNEIAKLKKEFGGDQKEMDKWIAENGMTESYLRFSIGIEYLHSAIYYTLRDAGWYEYNTDNIDAFMDFVASSETYARTLHVFVENDEGEDVEANRQRAQSMCDYLMAEPDAEAKEALIRQYIGSSNNEDLMISEHGYYFTYGEMEKAYEEATFALSIGEVSPVVETADGFYVIMRLEPQMPYIMLNAQTLLSYYQSAAMGAYIEKFDADCKVELNEYGKSLDLLSLN